MKIWVSCVLNKGDFYLTSYVFIEDSGLEIHMESRLETRYSDLISWKKSFESGSNFQRIFLSICLESIPDSIETILDLIKLEYPELCL